MSLPRKIIIHAGMTKAGSTSFQNFMDANRTALIQKGVLFPQTGFSRKDPFDETRTSGHLALLHILEMGQNKKLIRECAQYGDQIHTLVLSAENLFLDQSRDRLRLLKAFFRNCEISLIVVLRHQLDWILSRYTENVIKGWKNETRSIDRFCEDFITDTTLDYAERISWIKKTLRARRVYALDYGRLSESGELISAMLHLMKVDPAQFVTETKRRDNQSLIAATAVEAQRRINFAAQGLSREACLEWSATQRQKWHQKIAAGTLSTQALAPSSDVRDMLEAHVAPLNKILAKTYLRGEPLHYQRNTDAVAFNTLDEAQVFATQKEGLASFIATRDTALAPGSPEQVPFAVTLPVPEQTTAQEMAHLLETYSRAHICVECGSQTSTLLAAGFRNLLVLVFEQDHASRVPLIQHLDQTDAPAKVVVHAGDTLQDLWNQPWFVHPDLVRLSDQTPGRDFEALIALASEPVTILVPNITRLDAAQWRIPAIEAVRITDTLVTLQFTPQSADRTKPPNMPVSTAAIEN